MSQKWCRSKCIKGLCTSALLVFSLTIFHGSLQATQRPSPLPKILQEVQAQYSKAATLSAEFTQTSQDAAFSKKQKKNSGKIFFKRPSKVRWEMSKPEPSILVGDGKKYLYYTPPFDEDEKGQLIEKKASEVQSKLAESLLAGSFSTKQIQKIQQRGPNSFLLIPKPGMAGTVIRATIEIESDKKLIQKIILEHRGGNRSELVLSHIELGPTLPDSLFEFTPPPNTDIVGKSP